MKTTIFQRINTNIEENGCIYVHAPFLLFVFYSICDKPGNDKNASVTRLWRLHRSRRLHLSLLLSSAAVIPAVLDANDDETELMPQAESFVPGVPED
eukprot:3515421-Amphidinium_carterae.1